MKKDLEKMLSESELQPLNQLEERQINGGWLLPVLVAAAVVEIISDWDNFKAGLSGKPPVPQTN